MFDELTTAELVVVAGLAGLAAARLCVHAAFSAGSQIFGRTLIATRNPNEIALTFDDGPNDPYTGQLLDVLAQHQVKATFFMIGDNVRQRPDIVRAVQSAGHLIGNHTMTHPWLTFQSPAKVRQELGDCNAVLEDVLGQPVSYFRPPYGARRPDVLRAARELGLEPVMWNIMCGDWKPTSTAAGIQTSIEEGLARNRHAGRSSNVLLHDGGQAGISRDRSATVSAVRTAVPKLLESQYRFTTFI